MKQSSFYSGQRNLAFWGSEKYGASQIMIKTQDPSSFLLFPHCPHSLNLTAVNAHISRSKRGQGIKDERLMTILFSNLTNLLELVLNVDLRGSEMKWSLQNPMKLIFKLIYYLKPSEFMFSGTIGLPQVWERYLFLLVGFLSGKEGAMLLVGL